MKSFGNIAKDGQVRAVASGALTDGSSVIINSDGTVSVVAIGAVSASTSGTKFDDADGTMGLSYDSANGKVVIAYKDQGDSNKGKAVVATVSGTSISFGTPAVFNTGSTGACKIAYDANAQKHVIIYNDVGNSNYGTAVVATVSGTSISFGSETVFESASSGEFAIAYNSTAQKVVLFYRVSSQTNDGTLRVGTVSGTSISFGTVNRFENGCENQSIAYDSSNDKMVLAYRDGGNSDKGVVRVGTVSGTTISVGSEVEYESGDSLRNQIVYDETSGKIVIAYAEETNSNHGTAIAGTVSGTSVTFGSKVVFNAEETSYLGITYDASAGKPIIAFRDGNTTTTSAVPVELDGTTVSFGTTTTIDTSGERYRQQIVYDATSESNVIIYEGTNEGFASVYKAASTNLTSENFIGFSDGAYADTQSAAINTTNTIDRNQSGLTAGQTYFVQGDGTLGLTADDPSVTAGTAISATELIVKG